ncbi:hypothetical protein BCR42DRAFT_414518 [Absidia repens]|uniref:Uncharacterized protein n=1 Tax=Absidia repens TaxID=90262 RepID=A0A1X2IJ43_9FUNG|nr:hypothetical protein BCR42DRAFT_414518 [Absidia repens]
MGSRPLIYCCVPRAGMMTLTFWYGLTHWFGLFIIAILLSLSEEQFLWVKKIVDPDDQLGEDTLLDYLDCLACFVIGYAYFYMCYLAYKRNFKPINKLLYFFAADLVWGVGIILMAVHNEFKNTMKESKITVNELPEDPKKYEVQVETPIKFGLIFWLFLWHVVPFINKVYVFLKIRAYIKYVEYKKEEAETCSKSKD